MKRTRILLGIVYILLYALLLLIRSSSPDQILEGKETEAVFITMRSPTTILVALTLSFILLYKAVAYLHHKKYELLTASTLAGLSLLFVAGQVIVQEPYSVEEYFIVIKLREEKFENKKDYYQYQDLNYFSQQLPQYPKYSDSLGGLFREYKTGNNNHFRVFNGFGPIFALEDRNYESLSQ